MCLSYLTLYMYFNGSKWVVTCQRMHTIAQCILNSVQQYYDKCNYETLLKDI